MIITTLLSFAVTIGVLVVFHELGHYWVARLCDVKVLRFSVGFGNVLYSRRFGKGETEWAISAIPLGGYVKMLDEREGEVPAHELSRAFNRKPVLQRMAIVAAGPVFNLLLAVILYFGLFAYGVPGVKAEVGAVPAGTPAAAAKILPQEVLTSINGEPMPSWGEVHWRLLNLALARGDVEIIGRTQDGATHTHMLDMSSITPSDLRGDFMQKLGLQLYTPPVLGKLMQGEAAEAAGLRPGDRVLRVDGQDVSDWQQWVDAVRSHPEHALHVDIARDGHQLAVDITPKRELEGGETIGRVGAYPSQEAFDAMRVTVRYPLQEAFAQGLYKTWDISTLTLKIIGRMAMGQVSLRNLSGPIRTATFAGSAAEMGLVAFLFFLALISVSVGVLNLLPIPILDGGHLLYYMAEFFTGRPVPERAWEAGQKVGAVVLFLLMLLVLYNDINSLISG